MALTRVRHRFSVLEVHRQPRLDGSYADVRILRRGQDVEIAALPGTTLAVADIL